MNFLVGKLRSISREIIRNTIIRNHWISVRPFCKIGLQSASYIYEAADIQYRYASVQGPLLALEAGPSLSCLSLPTVRPTEAQGSGGGRGRPTTYYIVRFFEI